jgi:hypothetical protein
VAVLVSPVRACRVWLGAVSARRKPGQEVRGEKKRLSPLLTRFVGDGGLNMSNNAAGRAIRPIALGGKNYSLRIPAPESGNSVQGVAFLGWTEPRAT